jgi:hypothetical protein
MAVASNRYSGLKDLGASEFVFYFEGTDDDLVLVRIDRDGKVLAPSDKDWEKAKDSKQALRAYNIERYDSPNGQTSIDVADDDILYARYLVAFGNESNVETDPSKTGTSDRNFYTGGVVSGPRSFGSPNKVRYQNSSTKQTGTLAYPINIDIVRQDFLQINKYRYSRDSGANLSNPGDLARGATSLGTVILPMPKVSDSNGAEWGESDLNVFGVGAVSGMKFATDAIQGAIGAGFDIEKVKKAMAGLNAPIPSTGDVTGAASVAGALGGSELLKSLGITVSPDQLLARATGKIINPNAELLFQGPVLRDFGFQYLMVARSEEEGKEIRKIIRFFKEGAAPKYKSQALLGTPDIFSLEYVVPGDTEILNKFHDMALRTITVDYAPDGFWSAYQDSHPVAVRMSLQFTELKPVYDKDYKDLKDDQVGY